jgi:hypothetical protein
MEEHIRAYVTDGKVLTPAIKLQVVAFLRANPSYSFSVSGRTVYTHDMLMRIFSDGVKLKKVLKTRALELMHEDELVDLAITIDGHPMFTFRLNKAMDRLERGARMDDACLTQYPTALSFQGMINLVSARELYMRHHPTTITGPPLLTVAIPFEKTFMEGNMLESVYYYTLVFTVST